MPIRPYLRFRVGRNAGIFVTPGRSRKKLLNQTSGKGCLSVFYWVLIGWWLKPLIWIGKQIWFAITSLFAFLSAQIVKRSASSTRPISLHKGHFIAAGLLIIPFCLCFGGALVYGMTPAGKAAATSRSLTETAMPTETMKQTNTLRPTKTSQFTKTERPTRTKTIMPAFTKTRAPSSTYTPLPPTKTPDSNAPCNCQFDYDCDQFQTHAQAQRCFEYCGGSPNANFAGLDGNDRDGKVCESLP